MSAHRLLDSEALPGRLALSLDEAAGAVGVSRDFFDEHVRPELRVVRRGRRWDDRSQAEVSDDSENDARARSGAS